MNYVYRAKRNWSLCKEYILMRQIWSNKPLDFLSLGSQKNFIGHVSTRRASWAEWEEKKHEFCLSVWIFQAPSSIRTGLFHYSSQTWYLYKTYQASILYIHSVQSLFKVWLHPDAIFLWTDNCQRSIKE